MPVIVNSLLVGFCSREEPFGIDLVLGLTSGVSACSLWWLSNKVLLDPTPKNLLFQVYILNYNFTLCNLRSIEILCFCSSQQSSVLHVSTFKN